jgi:predicted RNA methylase
MGGFGRGTGSLGISSNQLIGACTIVCVNTQNKVEISGGKHDYGKGTEETGTGSVV